MISSHASKLRWLEPIGQMIVLVALGLQFFFVNSAIEASNQATTGYIQALLEQHTLSEHPERAQSPIEIDRAKVALADAQISAKEKKANADVEKVRSARLYIWLFVFGTLVAIIGKSGSVAYATKSSSANEVSPHLPERTPLQVSDAAGASKKVGSL